MTGQVPMLDVAALEELAACWRASGVPVVDRLRPGLSEDAIDMLTLPLEIRLPVEARVWWGWHDGAAAEGVRWGRELELAPGLVFMPLAEAVERCLGWREIARDWRETAPAERPWWLDSWFPITDAGQAGIVACECAVPEGEPTPIRSVLPPEPGTPVPKPVLSSLGGLVHGLIEAFDSGVWRYAPVWAAPLELRPEIDRRLFGPADRPPVGENAQP